MFYKLISSIKLTLNYIIVTKFIIQYLFLHFIIIKMKRQKKTNNIFNFPILPQSLFHEQVQKQYKIGGVTIQGTWLKDSSPEVYQGSVSSALQISQMRNQLNQMKRNAQLSPADMFRMAQIKKKMDTFQLQLQRPQKKPFQQNLKVQAQNLMLHKLHNMWGDFLRKCKIQGNELIYSSQKQKKQIIINIQNYSLELQQKGKTKKQTQAFVWPQKIQFKTRLYLSGQKLRPLCVYGDQKVLKNLLKKIKINSVKISQINFFKKLSKLYQQKIYVLFGNRLRVYEHLLKQREKDDLNFAFQLLQKSHLLQQIPDTQKNGQRNNQQVQSETSSKRNKSKDKDSMKSGVSKSLLGSQILGSPIRTISNENSSQFKMKSRRSNINYQDLEQQQEVSEMKIQDFKLQIKEAAESDDQAEGFDLQQHLLDQNRLGASIQINKKRGQSKKFQQFPIMEYINQDMMSQSSSKIQIDSNKKSKIKFQSQQDKISSNFEVIPYNFSHHICIQYFQDYCLYNQPQLQIAIYQKVRPDIEYQNMKIPVCMFKIIKLFRDQTFPEIFRPEGPIHLKLSKQAAEIQIFLISNPKQSKQLFQIELKKIFYTIDVSQLIYIKIDKRIHCAGKLKIIASNQPIDPDQHIEQSTEQFLQNYLLKQIYRKQDKYKFVDYKKKNQEILQRWNDKIMKRILNKMDEAQFHKAVFCGFPKGILDRIQSQFKRSKMNLKAQTRVQSQSSFFSQHAFAMMEGYIVRMKCYDLRVYITIDKLINLIVQCRKNQYLQKRIEDICTYLNLKFGKASMQKFMAVYVIETLKKTQHLLLQLKNAKQIQVFLQQYFQVEFQIDDIMKNISVYFN